MRLLGLAARMELVWIGRGKASALLWYGADLVAGLGAVATTYLLAERFDGIGRWSRAEVLFLLGYALLVRGLVETFFGWNVAFISRRIGRGQLDHMLLQPQSLLTSILTEGFGPLTGSGLVIAGALVLHGSAIWGGPLFTAAFALNVLASVVIVLAYSYAWASVAFWAPRSAEEINSSTMEFVDQLKGFPLDGLGCVLTAGLMTVVPVAFVAWWPTRMLLDESGPAFGVLVTPGCALLAAGVATLVFRRGMKRYGHTGSVRYLALGHRR